VKRALATIAAAGLLASAAAPASAQNPGFNCRPAAVCPAPTTDTVQPTVTVEIPAPKWLKKAKKKKGKTVSGKAASSRTYFVHISAF
jgi:hypothetical protein